MDLDLTSLAQSIAALRTAIQVWTGTDPAAPAALRDTLRGGVIQAFEVCYEQCWKFIQRWLQINADPGIANVLRTRRDLYRHAANQGLIADAAIWFTFGLARNATSHTYNAQTAAQVAGQALQFVDEAQCLLNKLQSNEA